MITQLVQDYRSGRVAWPDLERQLVAYPYKPDRMNPEDTWGEVEAC